MMLITKELSLKIESCIKQSHLEFTKNIPQGAVMNIGSGAAFFSGKSSYFSQVIAWGFNTSEQKFYDDIKAIEDFYRKHTLGRVDIELSSLVGNSVIVQLSNRGYWVSEASNISILNLKNATTVNDHIPGIVKQIGKNNLEDWACCVASGFGCSEAWEQIYLYGKAKKVICFGVFVEQQIVAGAAIAIHDGICDLGFTSTLPNYRGYGFQKALLNKRIDYAIQSGAEIASVTTEPGSISDLNIQKKGFQIAYTRLKFTRNE